MSRDPNVFSIKGLTLNGRPLMSFTTTFEVNGVPAATAVPVAGTSFTGREEGSKWLADLDYGTPATVSLTHGGGETVLFKGRISGVSMDSSAGSHGVSGKSYPTVALTHSLGDLEAFSFGQREFAMGGWRKRFEPPFTAGRTSALLQQDLVDTPELRSLKPGAHIRELMTYLTEWYQHETSGERIDVRSLLKATTAAMRNFNDANGVMQGIRTASLKAVTGGLGTGATVLALARTLASFCLFSIVPRLEDGVLIPDVPVMRHAGGKAFSSRYVIDVWSASVREVLPITRVCVHTVMPARFESEKTGIRPGAYAVDLMKDSDLKGAVYPPLAAGEPVDNILVSMPPPVLESLLTRILGDEGRPLPVARDAKVMSSASILPESERRTTDLYGREPQTQAATDGLTVAEAAAKAIYCARAYAGRTARVSFAPGYVLGGGLAADFERAGWEDDSVWGFLGKTVRFQSPYPEGGGLAKQDLIGYVRAMTVSLEKGSPSARVEATLDNVRTVAQDRKHSLLPSQHPLFTDVSGLKVEA